MNQNICFYFKGFSSVSPFHESSVGGTLKSWTVRPQRPPHTMEAFVGPLGCPPELKDGIVLYLSCKMLSKQAGSELAAFSPLASFSSVGRCCVG